MTATGFLLFGRVNEEPGPNKTDLKPEATWG